MIRSWSDFETSPSMSSRRFRLFVFLVSMWRACECPRLIFPVAVSRTRLAVPLCVFSFGIVTPKHFQILFLGVSSLPALAIPLSSHLQLLSPASDVGNH